MRAWLFSIVRNCHRDWQLARGRVQAVEVPGEDDEIEAAAAVASEEDTPETLLIRQSEVDRVRAVLASLAEPLREVLVLREMEELSYREIAEVARLPIGTVMSRLARARAVFAQAWRRVERGGAP